MPAGRRTTWPRASVLLGMVAGLVALSSGCLADGADRAREPLPPLDAAELSALRAANDEHSKEIAELLASIERDHQRLEELVTSPRADDAPPLHDDETLREIAERLSRQTRRLEALRAARAAR